MAAIDGEQQRIAHREAVVDAHYTPFSPPMALTKYARLSVQPVTAEEWRIVCAMGGLKGV